jgi:alkylation response protein AidB-like acyl-CoA dehydrogenase
MRAGETEAVLARVRALVPVLSAREAETNAAREVPTATIAAYRDGGILRVLQPRRFGGLQLPFDVFSRIVEIGMQQTRAGVQGLVDLCGSRSVMDADPLQAMLCDLPTIATHQAFSLLATVVPYQRWLRGLPPDSGEA